MLCVRRVMKKPPKEIDGAKVIEWAWSGTRPFGVLRFESGELAAKIFGLAICSYTGSDSIYRFSCGPDWEVEQDSDCGSIADAKARIPSQYQEVKAVWQKYE